MVRKRQASRVRFAFACGGIILVDEQDARWTDLVDHIAVAHKSARPHWGKGWKLLIELSMKVDEDLSDLHRFAMNNSSSPRDGIHARDVWALPMDCVYRGGFELPKDRWVLGLHVGWYVWAQVPKGEGRMRLRQRVAAARAQIALAAKHRRSG